MNFDLKVLQDLLTFTKNPMIFLTTKSIRGILPKTFLTNGIVGHYIEYHRLTPFTSSGDLLTVSDEPLVRFHVIVPRGKRKEVINALLDNKTDN